MRQAWPDSHIVLRGDGRLSNPELMMLCENDARLDFIFGLAGNKALSPKAVALLKQARTLHQTRCENARRSDATPPKETRLYSDIDYQAGSWPKAYRVVLKAEVMALGDTSRFVVTSLAEPVPEAIYRDL